MSRGLFCTAMMLMLSAAEAVPASMVSLTPSQDNTLIQETSPTSQLSNGLGDIFVGRTNQDGSGPATISIRRGLVAFDIADNVPTGATITSVTLTMRDLAQSANGASTIGLYGLLQNWGQGTSFQNGGMGAAATNNDATWLYTFYNAANPSASPTWTTAGGSYNATPSATAVDGLTSAGLVTWSSTSNPQMLTDVQNWLTNPSTNFGWEIIGNESTGQTARRFDGMYDTTSPNVAPVLAIQYTLVPVPEPSGTMLAVLGILGFAATRIPRIRRRLACG